jgi:type VI secretion system protein ImpK
VQQPVKERIERRLNLAYSFQELFTAIVRVRFNLQKVPNADAFRVNAKNLIRHATQEAAGRGYTNEDVKLAAFAIVAFLDESVLTSENPIFATWSRVPLQQELFGEDMAGETFFHHVQLLLGRQDSVEVVDVLEVYYLCMLMGYRGRYGSHESSGFTSAFAPRTDRGSDFSAVVASIKDKTNRVRGLDLPLSPAWALPVDPPRQRTSDPWFRRMAWMSIVSAVLAIAIFAASELILASGNSALQSVADQIR